MTGPPNQLLPWGTMVIAAGTAAGFVASGSAPDYRSPSPEGHLTFPTIAVLFADVLRHPNGATLITTLLLVLPVAAAVERVVGAVGIAAVYVVAGVGAGFFEAVRAASPVPASGAFGGTTALLTIWAVVRWRRESETFVTGLVIAGWLVVTASLRPGPFPLLGCCIAACVGLYSIDATPRAVERSRAGDR